MIEILLQAERELTMDRLDQAERLYWQAIEADPRNAIAVVGLARVAIERGDDRTAYAFAVQALGIDPEDAVALRLEARLAEVMATRGESVHRPAFVVAASEAALARRRARIEAAEGTARRRAVARPHARHERAGRRPRTASGTPARPLPPLPRPLMHVLVTGGAGYVGSVSVERLLEAGHEVTVLDSLVTGHALAVPPEAELVVGSVGDPAAVVALLLVRGIDAVLHCAARSQVGESMRDPALYYHENVVGGIALLEAMREAGLRRLVFSSTAAVYGLPETIPVAEDAPLRPVNPYGATKLAFESALTWYGAAYGLRSVSLRYFNVAGATAAHGEDHRPGDAPRAQPPDGRPERPSHDRHGRRLPHPRRDVRARLHPRGGSRRRPPGRPRADGGRRLAASRSATWARGPASPCARCSTRSRRPPVGRCRTSSAPAAPAIRRALVASNGRAAEVLGWQPRRGTLAAMLGSAWAWREAHPQGYEAVTAPEG